MTYGFRIPMLAMLILAAAGCGGGGSGQSGEAVIEYTRCPVGGELVPAPRPDGFWARNAVEGTTYSGISRFGNYLSPQGQGWQPQRGFSVTSDTVRITPNLTGAESDARWELPAQGENANLNIACSTAAIGSVRGRLHNGQTSSGTMLEVSSMGGWSGKSWSDFGVTESWAGSTDSASQWYGTQRVKAGVFSIGSMTTAPGMPGTVRPDWWPAQQNWTGRVTYVGTVIGWGSTEWEEYFVRKKAHAVQGSIIFDLDFSTGRVLGGTVQGLAAYDLDLGTGAWTANTMSEVNSMSVGVAALGPIQVDRVATVPVSGTGFVSAMTLARKSRDCFRVQSVSLSLNGMCDLSVDNYSATLTGLFYGPQGQELGGLIQVSGVHGDVILSFSALPALAGP